jgi:Tol biopolymer transport system component
MVPAAGGQAVKITPAAPQQAFLGFTGNRLVYMSQLSGTHDIWSVPVRDGKPDGSPEVVKRQFGDHNFIGITPTGSLLYGVATRPVELFSADVAPSAAPKLLATPYTGAAHGPAYSPDGRFLAYVSGPYDSQQVRIRELATGIETTQNITLQRFMKLRWFPDGKSLLIMGAATRGQTGFYRYDLATKQVAPLFQFGGESRQDAASTAVPTPDGQSFVFKRTNGKDWSAVSIGDLSNGPVRDILRMEVPRYMRMFALSPDGKNLAISFRDGTFDKIAIMPSSGGEMRVIYEYPKDEYARAWGALAWSADGKHVFYQRQYQSIMDQAWRIPAAGGTSEPLFTSEIIREFAVHPDGKTITWQANSQYFDVYSLENLVKAGR